MSLDLVAYPQRIDGKNVPKYMAIDIDQRITDFSAIITFYDLLAEGHLDPFTGDYYVMQRDFEDVEKLS